MKAVFLDRVSILSEYDRVVHSPSFSMKLPSVIALKEFIPQERRPAFTRFNVFLRDRFRCQYCGEGSPAPELTFDHVIPRSRGGRTNWENVVTACQTCNLRKGNRLPAPGAYASQAKSVPAEHIRAPGERPRLPAELPPPELAGFSLLGFRAGNRLRLFAVLSTGVGCLWVSRLSP